VEVELKEKTLGELKRKQDAESAGSMDKLEKERKELDS
jgi:hypothetical protein